MQLTCDETRDYIIISDIQFQRHIIIIPISHTRSTIIIIIIYSYMQIDVIENLIHNCNSDPYNMYLTNYITFAYNYIIHLPTKISFRSTFVVLKYYFDEK
jgi:hypothetical protein